MSLNILGNIRQDWQLAKKIAKDDANIHQLVGQAKSFVQSGAGLGVVSLIAEVAGYTDFATIGAVVAGGTIILGGEFAYIAMKKAERSSNYYKWVHADNQPGGAS